MPIMPGSGTSVPPEVLPPEVLPPEVEPVEVELVEVELIEVLPPEVELVEVELVEVELVEVLPPEVELVDPPHCWAAAEWPQWQKCLCCLPVAAAGVVTVSAALAAIEAIRNDFSFMSLTPSRKLR